MCCSSPTCLKLLFCWGDRAVGSRLGLCFLQQLLFPSYNTWETVSQDSCQTFLWVPSEVHEEETTNGCGFPAYPVPRLPPPLLNSLASSRSAFTGSLTISAEFFNVQQHLSQVSKTAWLISPCKSLSFLRLLVSWLSCHLNSLMVSRKVLDVLFVWSFKTYFLVSVEWRPFQIFSISSRSWKSHHALVSLLLLQLFALPAISLCFPLPGNLLLVSVTSCSHLLKRQGQAYMEIKPFKDFHRQKSGYIARRPRIWASPLFLANPLSYLRLGFLISKVGMPISAHLPLPDEIIYVAVSDTLLKLSSSPPASNRPVSNSKS